MAFGIKKTELLQWKKNIEEGNISFLTHYWLDDRFPDCTTVTKVGCNNIDKLSLWGQKYGLKKEWIHHRKGYPHFDLLGDTQKEILRKEGLSAQLERFKRE
jgi:hypothetical protein